MRSFKHVADYYRGFGCEKSTEKRLHCGVTRVYIYAVIVKILFIILGFFLFLYLFWSRLKEDYVGNQVFSTGLFALTGIILGNLLFFNYFQHWFLWSGVFGGLVGSLLGIFKYKLRFFEVLEAAVLGGLFLLGLFLLALFILEKDVVSLGGALVVLLHILGFELIDKHYKTFTWYRSGKVGFTGLAIAGVFFLTIAFIAVSFSGMISFVNRNDAIISGLLAFLSFIALYNLSRKPL